MLGSVGGGTNCKYGVVITGGRGERRYCYFTAWLRPFEFGGEFDNDHDGYQKCEGAFYEIFEAIVSKRYID